MNCYWMLTSSDVDDWGWGYKKPLVLRKIAHAERGRHNDQPKRLQVIVELYQKFLSDRRM